MDDITIHMATLADVETIVANNLAMAEETEGLRLDRETVRSGVRRVLTTEERGRYYLAEQNGKVIGQLLITREWSDWRDDWFWWIQSVYVAPAARGAGVYRRLHEHVEQRARRTPGVCGLRLYVDRANTAALEVYRHLGMQPANYEFLEMIWKKPAPAAGQ